MRLIDSDKFILALMDASLSSTDEDTILDLVDSVPAWTPCRWCGARTASTKAGCRNLVTGKAWIIVKCGIAPCEI